MMTTIQALYGLLPGIPFTIEDTNDLNTLKVPNGVTPPTQAQVDAYIANNDYLQKQRSAYPPFIDLMDAVVDQQLGNPVPMTTLVQKVQQARSTFPNPIPIIP